MQEVSDLIGFQLYAPQEASAAPAAAGETGADGTQGGSSLPPIAVPGTAPASATAAAFQPGSGMSAQSITQGVIGASVAALACAAFACYRLGQCRCPQRGHSRTAHRYHSEEHAQHGLGSAPRGTEEHATIGGAVRSTGDGAAMRRTASQTRSWPGSSVAISTVGSLPNMADFRSAASRASHSFEGSGASR